MSTALNSNLIRLRLSSCCGLDVLCFWWFHCSSVLPPNIENNSIQHVILLYTPPHTVTQKSLWIWMYGSGSTNRELTQICLWIFLLVCLCDICDCALQGCHLLNVTLVLLQSNTRHASILTLQHQPRCLFSSSVTTSNALTSLLCLDHRNITNIDRWIDR